MKSDVIERFSKVLPEVALRMTHHDASDVSWCEARDGAQNLGYGDKYIHSNYSPIKEAERWFSGLDLVGVQVLYVYGVGLGYYYDAAKAWLAEDASRYLVFIEDNYSILCRLFEIDRGREIVEDSQVQVHVIDKQNDMASLIRWLATFFVLTNVDVSGLQHYVQDRSEEYNKLRLRLMHESLSLDSYSGETMRGGQVFFRNFSANLQLLPTAYHGNKLFGKFRNIPAIICGAGPSLQKNFDVLTGLRDNALIFAGGSSVNALSKNGFLPHFGGGIDPNPPQYERIMTNYAYTVPYFYRNRMYHDALEAIHGPRLYLNGCIGYPIAEWFEEQLGIEGKVLEEGYNVINFLIEIATHLGCNPIIFVGMDLAYTDMKAYASGVVVDAGVKEKDIINTRDTTTGAFFRKDVNGNNVYTLWKWTAESSWVSKYVQSHPETTFINATEGGIGFDGVDNMPLSEVAVASLRNQYPLDSLVHSAIQGASMGHVTEEGVKAAVAVVGDSLHRSVTLCDNILVEVGKMEKKLKSSAYLPSSLQTGKNALYECELGEEIAYKTILARISETMTMTIQRRLSQVMSDPRITSDRDRRMRTLSLNAEKIRFIKGVAESTLNEMKEGGAYDSA